MKEVVSEHEGLDVLDKDVALVLVDVLLDEPQMEPLLGADFPLWELDNDVVVLSLLLQQPLLYSLFGHFGFFTSGVEREVVDLEHLVHFLELFLQLLLVESLLWRWINLRPLIDEAIELPHVQSILA